MSRRSEAGKQLQWFDMAVYNAAVQWLAADVNGSGWGYNECKRQLRGAIECMRGYLKHQVMIADDDEGDGS